MHDVSMLMHCHFENNAVFTTIMKHRLIRNFEKLHVIVGIHKKRISPHFFKNVWLKYKLQYVDYIVLIVNGRNHVHPKC